MPLTIGELSMMISPAAPEAISSIGFAVKREINFGIYF
jgi:hypothetical protein